MRGKEHVAVAVVCLCRITPAYAGKRKNGGSGEPRNEDHPRLCGEKHTRRCPSIDCSGITPAYAGKRWQRLPPRSEQQDHPRLCGEKSPLKSPLVARIGSPPPMRGKVGGKDESSYALRITPAYAGKRGDLRHYPLAGGDHPRLCGEKVTGYGTLSQSWGSPPPMRGKVFGSLLFRFCCRITPAYAGKRAFLHRQSH